jgi:hypothetical protein
MPLRLTSSRAGKPALRGAQSGRRRAQPALAAIAAVALEILRIGREMLVIPAQLWLAVAEILGAATLAGWRRIWTVLVAAYGIARRALAWAEQNVRPAHGVLAACVGAAVALAASQFLDYRGISVGTPAYSGVENVAPAPPIGQDQAGSAHAWVMLPLAALALVSVVLAARGRWRAARLLVPIGVAVVVVTLAIDLPKGLDEGSAAVAYEGAKASLLEGFWSQLAAGVVLIACAPLLGLYLRPGGAPAAERRRWLRRGAAGETMLGSSPVADPPIEGTRA